MLPQRPCFELEALGAKDRARADDRALADGHTLEDGDVRLDHDPGVDADVLRRDGGVRVDLRAGVDLRRELGPIEVRGPGKVFMHPVERLLGIVGEGEAGRADLRGDGGSGDDGELREPVSALQRLRIARVHQLIRRCLAEKREV